MTRIRRLVVVCTGLAIAAMVASPSVWGEAGKKPGLNPLASGSQSAPDITEQDLASSKFSKGGVITYRAKDGGVYFALSVKPKLQAAPARPRDYFIMVDTSASQFGGPLAAAKLIAEEITARAGPQDRISLWTVNTPKATKDLTHGFQNAKSPAVKNALAELKNEVPLGDTDLKGGLEKAIKVFGGERERQRLIVFLGDGMSIHDPIAPAERAKLCDEMVSNEVAFFPVPLGPHLDPQNLHGFTSGTGGRVVRLLPNDKIEDVLQHLQQAFAAPILYATAFKLPADVTESLPTKLPPLRPDTPTLVIGKFKPGKELSYTVEGTVAGRNVRVQMSEPVAEAELDNFFLIGMVDQWRNAKDQPALLQADRALAIAQTQNQMALAEMLALAEEALAENNLPAAQKLFQDAKTIDPHNAEADGGLKVVKALHDGRVTIPQLRDQLGKRNAQGLLLAKGENGQKDVRRGQLKDLVAQLQPGAAQGPAPKEEIAPDIDPNSPLKQEEQRLAIAEQRASQIVEEALRQARQLVNSDPEGAHDLLMRVLAGVRDDFDLSPRTQRRLTNRLEATLRDVDLQGRRIKQTEDEQMQLAARAAEKLQVLAKAKSLGERTSARMRVFHTLMNQARFLDAYRQAQAIRQDAVNQGQTVPVSVTAGYDIGLVTTNLQELRELRRRREERYLLTMMQVERSHVPSPDEPPVEFPPAAMWRELTRMRKEKYENSALFNVDEATRKQVTDLQKKMDEPISVEFPPGSTLKDALDYIRDLYNITFIVDEDAFKNDADNPIDFETQPVPKQVGKLKGVSMSTVLRLLLGPVKGSYWIRPGFVEITTARIQTLSKTLRVYPVADLVIPIPNSVNQQVLQQNFQLLGGSLTIGGGGFLGATALFNPFGLGGLGGGLGALGLGGGLGALGGGLGALGGGLGALGGGLGALGGGLGMGGLGAGGGFGGGGMGFVGGGFQNGPGQGFGGGFAGIGGGQQGQFGNLGGQFGIQGGNTSMLLIRLITQVVGYPRDWAAPWLVQQFPGAFGIGPEADQDKDVYGDPNLSNSIGFYDPAMSLIVRGTSRVNTSLTGGIYSAPAGPGPNQQTAIDRNNPDRLAKASGAKGGGRGAKGGIQVAGAGSPKRGQVAAPLTDLDARKIWQDALAKGLVQPRMIIETADVLFAHKKFSHAAEFLKADLRQGIVAEPWVYEALTLALKEGKGSLDDIERAQLSIVDFAPRNAEGYLHASSAMADLHRWDRALAFCRQASLLEPNAPAPYADALLYADAGQDPQAMEWAAGNLLSRDWPADNDKLHNDALNKLRLLARRLQDGRQKHEVDKMLSNVDKTRQRDLVLQLSWAGDASLDMEIREPIGTVCSFMHRQTPGGGTYIGSTLGGGSHESYVATEAFPGTYQVRVRRLWGKPLGSRAVLTIIQHQGTPEERVRRETVVFDNSQTLKVTLDSGRRKSAAHVPPESSQRPRKADAKKTSGPDILTKLRALADPDLDFSQKTIQGGVSALGLTAASLNPPRPPAPTATDPVAFQSTVSPFTNSLDLTAQATVTADRRYVRLSLAPVFQTVTNVQPMPVVSVIPGTSGP